MYQVIVFFLFGVIVVSAEIDSKKCLLDTSGVGNRNDLGVRESPSDYENLATALINHFRNSCRNQTWNFWKDFTTTYGPRNTGSQALEDASEYMANLARDAGFDNVQRKDRIVEAWVRGSESGTMEIIGPSGAVESEELEMAGVGKSISGSVSGEVVVVHSKEELESVDATGKIVVFNQGYTSYTDQKDYRVHGADWASEKGAIAAVIQSISNEDEHIHTGSMSYSGDFKKIPACTVPGRVAKRISELVDQGNTVKISLNLESEFKNVTTRNLLFDLRGEEKPDEVVVVLGHIDSWDIGKGALDNAATVAAIWYAMQALKDLPFRPRRTIRVGMFSAHELGYMGSKAFWAEGGKDVNWVFAMEGDNGGFTPTAFYYSGSDKEMMQRIAHLLDPITSIEVFDYKKSSDMKTWINAGVPGVWINNPENYKNDYFVYHHSNGDTYEQLVKDGAMSPKDLDNYATTFAVTSFLVADMQYQMGKEGQQVTAGDNRPVVVTDAPPKTPHTHVYDNKAINTNVSVILATILALILAVV